MQDIISNKLILLGLNRASLIYGQAQSTVCRKQSIIIAISRKYNSGYSLKIPDLAEYLGL
jgi:hypothetical protein